MSGRGNGWGSGGACEAGLCGVCWRSVELFAGGGGSLLVPAVVKDGGGLRWERSERTWLHCESRAVKTIFELCPDALLAWSKSSGVDRVLVQCF